jgi:hypothetical protein
MTFLKISALLGYKNERNVDHVLEHRVNNMEFNKLYLLHDWPI